MEGGRQAAPPIPEARPLAIRHTSANPSLILSRELLNQPRTITAYGNGGGPLAACGDVPDTLLDAG